jgi:membrane dipeptidase
MALLFDGHLDLAMNALRHERDQRLPVERLRLREEGGAGDSRGIATVSLDALRRAGTAVVVTSVIARCKPWIDSRRVLLRNDLDYPDASMAYAAAQGELAYYRLLESQGQVRIIQTSQALADHIKNWQDGRQEAVGLIITMEGADPIVEPGQLAQWHDQGLRTLMLAHFGRSRYAAGTPSDNPSNRHDIDDVLSDLGIALLKQMDNLKMPLDLTHCDDKSFFQAAELFPGSIYSSHSACRALVNLPRNHSDEQLDIIVQRGGVIGIPMFNAYLYDGYKPATPFGTVGLQHVVDHVMHICQRAGSARHVAIGSDLDGGFGAEHTPRELDRFGDLIGLEPLLRQRGFDDQDVADFFYGNWLRFWQQALPGDQGPV